MTTSSSNTSLAPAINVVMIAHSMRLLQGLQNADGMPVEVNFMMRFRP